MTDGLSGSATAAYTRIYEEQHPRLVAYARSLTRNSWTAEDLVAEAHFRVWRRLSGGHEIDNVPAYLMTTVRHLAAAVGSTATRETPLDPTAPERAEADVRVADATDPAEQVSSVDLLVRVLGQLPERWVQALWLAEAEGQPLETVGQRIGAKQGATAVLLHRAREGMRQAFLREQPGAPIDPACQVRWGRMPAYVRGTATARQSEQLLSHVDACDDCRARLAVLMRTNDRLPAFVGPALLVFVVGGGGGKLLMALTGGSAGTAAVLGSAGGHGGGQVLHAVRQAAGGAGGVKVPAVAAVGAAAAAAAVVAGIVLGPLDSGAGPERRVPVAQAPAPHRPEVASPDVVEHRGAVTDVVVSPRGEGAGGGRGGVGPGEEGGGLGVRAPESPGGEGSESEEPGVDGPGGEEPGVEEPRGEEPAGSGVEPPVEEAPPVVEPPTEEAPPAVEPPAEEAPPVVEPPAEEAPPVVEPPTEEAPPVQEPVEPSPEDPEGGGGGPGGGC
ncbi:sigma-70 family RNA polymerase sigma factor [Streptomyces sp. 11x1]|uniref:sigma-70 family RNA polymerase sigma factor n=1 Tax=Streptomyces sp. 11x1 TaxID=3038642 RepID=UPI00292EC9A6|nr:sigma-70 family RNA polymerase sigma factor [Streptomyces sp. 11x1]WNZ11603.1 sigma-70 family RNA polymerase sigma factor [Streptomyces sp. 11x1]